ncbi:MAG: radical SAM protein [Ignavibacteriales bacterium]|nr:radical SAM protein [Ignavibacteriales bacterium]
MNLAAFKSTLSPEVQALPVVILYVTAACNLRCVTCSYRDPLPQELTLEEYRDLARQLEELGLRHIVYSGGEPLVRRDFPEICRIFEDLGVRQSLLTNGLLLEKRARDVVGFFDEIIVSIDGPDATTHNAIRGLECFDRIVMGVERIASGQPRPLLSIRTVIQRRNFRRLDAMVDFAKRIGADRISFLSADVLSNTFHRDHVGPVASNGEILLSAVETKEFRDLMTRMIAVRKKEIQSGFIAESARKLLHIVEYFEAFHSLSPFPRNHCNAPNVSTVITSTGELLPCYFLPSYGAIRSGLLKDQVNNDLIKFTRKQVGQYSLEQCRKCVCTLRISPWTALRDGF